MRMLFTIHRETDIARFAARVQPFLMQREAQHNVLLGLLTTFQQRPPSDPPYMAYAERDGEVMGAAMRTPPYNVLLSHALDLKVVDALADDVHDCYGEVSGVVGAVQVVEQFSKRWNTLSLQPITIARYERLFMLTEVQRLPPIEGIYRQAREDEFERVVEWWMAFAAEALSPISREEAERGAAFHLRSDPALGGVRFWEVNGTVVALAAYKGPTPNSIRIGPVYTPPEHRKHGYGTALTAALSQELLNRGYQFITLYTDLANPTSNHIYQVIGYTPVCDVNEYTFAPVAVGEATL